MNTDDVFRLDLDQLQSLLPDWIVRYVALDPERRARLREKLAAILEEADPSDTEETLRRYREAGREFRFYPATALGRRISRTFIRELVAPGTLEGFDRFRRAVANGPCLAVSNHLSYSDSQFTDFLIASAGDPDLADRLVFIAGPKVYAHPFRRLAAICLHTLQTAQSSRLSYNDASLPPRTIARIAVQTVREARRLAREGYVPLLYAEGSRSRTGRLAPFLRGAARYPDASIHLLPLALSGTDQAFPVHGNRLQPAPVRLVVGEPVPGGGSDPEDALTAAWREIARHLPPSNRPEPGTEPLR